MDFPAALPPPIEPMLARIADALPDGPGFQFEPKWDGFRALAFRTDAGLVLQSRDLKPLDRYFPEIERALREQLPQGCILDGEIVIATPRGLDFDALQQRLHPARSRVERLSVETPASFVAFDLLGVDGRSTIAASQADRRVLLEALLTDAAPPLYLTPVTYARDEAARWLAQFEGAGLDGVVAKLESADYQPGKRAMLKIKHVRSADCVVAGLRLYKDQADAVGSLLLGLYDDAGTLHHVGVTSSFTLPMRRALLRELRPLRRDAGANHPWRAMTAANAGVGPAGPSRWSRDKDLSWEPLRPERVCEVRYDHLQGRRFRHATTFMRWRPDKAPRDCRYDQLEAATPYELARVFGA
jgi:ATP-dependent DNA ligase